MIQDTNLSLSSYRYSNLKCHYNHTDMFLFSVTILCLIQQTNTLLFFYWYSNLICWYNHIATANEYVTILLLIQDTNPSLFSYRYSHLICHYNHTDMFLLIQQYSLLLHSDTANYYVNIPTDTTITLLYSNWYSKSLHYYTQLIQQAITFLLYPYVTTIY